ncbi:50S ribosomal protein L17 [Candidatus Saccharibacteria bacterium]|nr:50S ribosomal protein L17 [Candidatus Saccharibacteria bacterium]
MHRHSYKGRKFGRETGERKALIRTLTISLIKSQSITTTLARAKEIRRSTERLITRAKKGGLANRRIIIARLNNIEAADFLINVIAPQITRDSGYLRIEREGFRKGDHAELGTISFVDDIDPEFSQKKAEKPTEKKETK